MDSPVENEDVGPAVDDSGQENDVGTGVVQSKAPAVVIGIRKPFKPPTLLSKPPANVGNQNSFAGNMGSHVGPSSSTMAKPTVCAVHSALHKPVTVYYGVLYRKRLNKKVNPFDEGIVSLNGASATLMNAEGKYVSRDHSKLTSATEGDVVYIGPMYEAEVTFRIDAELFQSGRIFIGGGLSAAGAAMTADAAVTEAPKAAVRALPAYKPPTKVGFRPVNDTAAPSPSEDADGAGASSIGPSSSCAASSSSAMPAPAPKSTVSLGVGRGVGGPRPKYDPNAPNALVLQRAGEGGAAVAVAVDPYIAQHLRPHQRAGVRFLWRCITGLHCCTGDSGPVHGAILADDMGLGKTLMTIATVWSAIKHSGAGHDRPLSSKVVIVTPSSLIGNWRNEFSKWLGLERCRPVAVTSQGKEAEEAVKLFSAAHPSVHPVLIISYEMARKYGDILAGVGSSTDSFPGARIGLLVCDEGHRLKASGGNKTMAALSAIGTQRKILLTGTPVQNNLEEFYAMATFACPGVLGSLSSFKRNFEAPIQAGRDRSASPAEAQLGAARAAELARKTSSFVLRRTADVLNKYLPPKTESIILCRMGGLQVELYTAIARAYSHSGLGGRAVDPTSALLALTAMGKACAHPDLLHLSAVDGGSGPGSGAGGLAGGAKALVKLAAKRPAPATAAASAEVIPGLQSSPIASDADADNDASLGSDEAEIELGSQDTDDDEDDADDEDEGAAGTMAGSAPVGAKADRGHRAKFVIDDSDGDDDGAGPAAAGAVAVGPGTGHSKAPTALLKSAPALSLDFTSQKTVIQGIAHLFPSAYVPGLLNPKTPALPLGQQNNDVPLAGPLQATVEMSGKLLVLDTLLRSIRVQHPWDRVVLVSSYGTALDIMEGLCRARGWTSLRLDGSTPAAERPSLVSRFNEKPPVLSGAAASSGPPPGTPFVFLLSSRAGGVGLNLIGANRLVLWDPNWNPAIDKQALARVWRDGQKKPCFIYRLLTCWSVEEKILQRQLLKEDLGAAVQSNSGAGGTDGQKGGSGAPKFSRAELKELFGMDPRDGGNVMGRPTVLAGAGSGGHGGNGNGIAAYGCDTYRMLAKAGQQGKVQAQLPGASTDATEPASPANPSVNVPWPAYEGPYATQAVDPVLASALMELEQGAGYNAAASSGSVGPGAGPGMPRGLPPVAFVRTLVYNAPAQTGQGAQPGAAAGAGAGGSSSDSGAPVSIFGHSSTGASGSSASMVPRTLADVVREADLTDSDEDLL